MQERVDRKNDYGSNIWYDVSELGFYFCGAEEMKSTSLSMALASKLVISIVSTVTILTLPSLLLTGSLKSSEI